MRRKSKNKYSPNWRLIALKAKGDADWCCVRCGHKHDPKNGYCLTVHHLDLDPANNEWWNIPPLCQKCHLSIQGRVIMEIPWMFEHSEWFKIYVAGYYASLQGLPTDKVYILQNKETILKQAIQDTCIILPEK